LAERGAIWAQVERLRRAISRQGMPRQATNQFGRVADFTLLEAKSQDEFVKHCQRASQNPLNAAVLEIIREAQERHLRVVFVVMPLPPRHVQTFYDAPAWQEYQGHLRELLAKQNIAVVDASRWFADANKFGDALHLNEEGAREFSQRLGALCGNVNQPNSCGN
jgi:lysophospholipase L1-like esterase